MAEDMNGIRRKRKTAKVPYQSLPEAPLPSSASFPLGAFLFFAQLYHNERGRFNSSIYPCA